MLFLINDRVLDIGDSATTAEQGINLLSDFSLHALRPRDAIEIGQAIYFSCEDGERPDDLPLKALAAVLAEKTEANCALFIKPPAARNHGDVLVRLADVPITTLAYLLQLQASKGCDARVVNDAVWRHAA